jgi:hypothetical protein
MDGRFNDWEALALGLAAGLLCEISPAPAALALTAAIAALLRHNAARALAPLCALVGAGLAGGPDWIVAGALLWQIAVFVERSGPSPAHALCAPALALQLQFTPPSALSVALAGVALVAWTDWAIGRLATRRLGERAAMAPFVLSQAAVVAPLTLLPSPAACLAALAAMMLARRWSMPVPRTQAAR